MSHTGAIELRVEVNPWAKGGDQTIPLADTGTLACIYDLHLGVDSLPEATCFRRTKKHDELWTAIIDDVVGVPTELSTDAYASDLRLAARAPRGGSPSAAAVRLFRHLVRSRTGFGWPVNWLAGGLINVDDFTAAVEAVKAGLQRNAAVAKQHEAPIIALARRLKLNPEPSGTSPTAWRARCPETHHHVYISSESNTFGCGYCRRKGGPDELEAFVGQRRAQKPANPGDSGAGGCGQ